MIDWVKIDKNTKLEQYKWFLLKNKNLLKLEIGESVVMGRHIDVIGKDSENEQNIEIMLYNEAIFDISNFTHYAHINLP